MAALQDRPPEAVPPRLPWVTIPEEPAERKQEQAGIGAILREDGVAHTSYMPLLSTLRLYAAWLLGWYFLVYALGGYQILRALPFRLSFLGAFVASSLLAEVSFGIFLFLLLTSLHRALKGSVLLGMALTLAGVIALGLFTMNMG